MSDKPTLKKRIHLVKRVMRGEYINDVAKDLDVSPATVRSYLTNINYYAHWVARHAGMDIDILSVKPSQIWKQRNHIASLFNHFDDQAAKFEKEPTQQYPFLYLDLSFRSYRTLAWYVRHYDGFDSIAVATIEQLVDVINRAGFHGAKSGLGLTTKLELIEALRVRKLDHLWNEARQQEANVLVSKYMEKVAE